MRHPADFYRPLCQGAPQPLHQRTDRLMRMIHFFPPHIAKIRHKMAVTAEKCDVVLGNLEDGITIDSKQAAREGLIEAANIIDTATTPLWVRVNGIDSPWGLDDLLALAPIGDKLSVIMVPKIETAADIHYFDRILAQIEAKSQIKKPLLLHAIIETAQGVINMEEIAGASVRMQGMSLGPADLAASRSMKTTRVGGGHPGYGVIADPCEQESQRQFYQSDIWHYTLARLVDACRANHISAFYGPFGDFSDKQGCYQQFRNAFLLGCVGTWTLHPSQIEIARQVFSPPPSEIETAKKIIAAIPDGAGAVVVDGRMQDDATVKQAHNIVRLAEMIAQKDKD